MQRDAVREKLNMLIETKCENEENKKQLDHHKDELKKLETKNSDLKSSYIQGQLEIGKLKEVIEKKDKDIEQLRKDLQHSQELHDADIKNLKAQLNRNARATHNHGDPADIKRLKNELMIREQETQMLKKDTDIKMQSYIAQIANLTEREAMYKSQVNRLLKEQKEIKNYDTINQQLGRANEELQLYKAKYIRKAKKYDKLKAFASKVYITLSAEISSSYRSR